MSKVVWLQIGPYPKLFETFLVHSLNGSLTSLRKAMLMLKPSWFGRLLRKIETAVLRGKAPLLKNWARHRRFRSRTRCLTKIESAVGEFDSWSAGFSKIETTVGFEAQRAIFWKIETTVGGLSRDGNSWFWRKMRQLQVVWWWEGLTLTSWKHCRGFQAPGAGFWKK